MIKANMKFLAFICSVLLFTAIPVQAAVNYCTHPTSYECVDRGYNVNYFQHQAWSQEYELCTSCGQRHHEEEIEYEQWEDHDWVVDWAHPDKIDDQLTFYEATCRICGLNETVANP